jgi:hypothetical protein
MVLYRDKKLESQLATSLSAVDLAEQRAAQVIASAQEQAKRDLAEAQNACQSRIEAAYQEANRSLAEAQLLVDQQIAEIRHESERLKEHYENEARKIKDEAEASLTKTVAELGPLRKFQKLHDAEAQVAKELADALAEATALRGEANSFLQNAKSFAASEAAVASLRTRELRERSEALLEQATRDGARVVSDAEKRAHEIGGDAYEALRDKHTLERAVQALWNITEGYGDRYVVPTHSLLDDLAENFGYTEAGYALKFARDQSRRMVEQKLAGASNYAEDDRRERANRFVVDAFNGRVDAILSRSRHDNYGTLEQEIKDAYSLVNLNGLAFRDAHIVPAYLEARLAELKWAVVVHELSRKQREEQKYLRDRMRDEEKARREYEEKMRQAAREEELKRQALAEAERKFAAASAEQKSEFEKELQKVRQELAEATQTVLTIAQQTKKGHVYVLSNIGSFGEGIYKIGQTRRLDPQERVDELGDASVPFEFDIHALIETDNAPALEHKLHKQFLASQVNKINPRREFFRVTLSDIRKEVDRLKDGEDFTVKVWTDKADAAEYKETVAIETDPAKREQWLSKQKVWTDRQLRLDGLRVLTLEPAMAAAQTGI